MSLRISVFLQNVCGEFSLLCWALTCSWNRSSKHKHDLGNYSESCCCCLLQLRLHEMSARLALHFLPRKPHGPAFHFGVGAPVSFPSVEAAGAASPHCSQLIPALNARTQTTDGAEDGRAGACPGRDSLLLGGSKNRQPLSCDCWHWFWLRSHNSRSKATASDQTMSFFLGLFVLLNLQWNGPGHSAKHRPRGCKADLNHLLPFLLPKTTFLFMLQCESSSLKQGTLNN